MRNTLPTIYSDLKALVEKQSPLAKSWGDGVQVIQETSKSTNEVVWWVRCDEPKSLLTADAIDTLIAVGALPVNAEPQRKRSGRYTALAWPVNATAAESALKQQSREGAKIEVLLNRTKELERQLRESQSDNADQFAMARLLETLDAHYKTKPSTKVRRYPQPRLADRKDLGGVPTLFLSDWHWGEVVEAAQIDHLNEYNLSIANARADKAFQIPLELLFKHQSGLMYEGIVCALGGDMLSGNIHDELRETNDACIPECVLSLVDKLSTGILTLAEAFPEVYVPCVGGNHTRLDKKVTYKNKQRNNLDYLVYQIVSRMVRGKLGDNCNVTFDISESPDLMYNIYNTRYLLTHGDQIKESTASTGFIPALIDVSRKKRERLVQNRGEGYDYMLCGHFHHYSTFNEVIVNGSLKGYDEFGYQKHFHRERAIQALWVTHPDHQITGHTPIYVDEPMQPMSHGMPPISFKPPRMR